MYIGELPRNKTLSFLLAKD